MKIAKGFESMLAGSYKDERQYFERYLCFYGESAIIFMYICEE
mgnify:CR=1 FL=1